MGKKRVLILCTGNSARSQMAEGLWKQMANGTWDAVSAGSDPAGYVHPLAVRAMQEIDVDISNNKSKHVGRYCDEPFDLVVTVCDHAAENCPVFSRARQTLHWPFDDPSHIEGKEKKRLEAFRQTREQIARRIRDFLEMHEDQAMSGRPSSPLDADGEFIDRDLSWLEFNRRVLHEAADERTPLLERLMFLGIFTSNLDEFFMKRVGRLRDRSEGQRQELYRSRLESLHRVVQPMIAEQERCFREEIRPALTEYGVCLLSWDELTSAELDEANRYFRENVFPALTPQAVDPSHPFPFISNLSDSLAIEMRYPDRDEPLFARVKVPSQLPAWVELLAEHRNGQRRFVSLREIIRRDLPQLFPGMVIEDVLPLRVTRSAQVDVEDVEAEDLLEQVEEELRQRRTQHVVRLEHAADPDRWLLDQVVTKLGLFPEQVYEMPGEMDYTDFVSIATLPITELRYRPWTPVTPRALAGEDTDIFSTIRDSDLLVHHPYESFDDSVAQFIRAAVHDPNVLAIKMTLYRTSDDTPFVPWLIQAAEAGKQVACLVELKARFDELRNIRWANALEDAGVHVVYGVVGMKTHTKTALVVRRDKDAIRSYVHIGTGNYHPKTAKLYTDLGLFTCDPQISEDVVELFHYLTGRSLKKDYNQLLVAPVNMKRRFLELIDAETAAQKAGRPARIIAQMNQLQDRDICHALQRASQAGVEIDLIVRGFCVLRPGLPDTSPTIRVTSVIGRFLEHSRIYYFRNGAGEEGDGVFLIGSADWMYRNLEERVEAVTPIHDRLLKKRLWDLFQILLADQRQAWEMAADGSYRQRIPSAGANDPSSLGTHEVLMQKNSPAR